MLAHDGRRLQADRSVTEGRALGAAGDDTYVLGHELHLHSASILQLVWRSTRVRAYKCYDVLILTRFQQFTDCQEEVNR